MAEESIFGSFEALQIIGVIISGFLLTKAIRDYKKSKLGKGSFVFWVVIWGFALFSFVVPRIPQAIFGLLERGDVFVIALILATIVLFVLVYIMFGQIFSVNRQLKLLVQKLALDERFKVEQKDDKEKSNEE